MKNNIEQVPVEKEQLTSELLNIEKDGLKELSLDNPEAENLKKFFLTVSEVMADPQSRAKMEEAGLKES